MLNLVSAGMSLAGGIMKSRSARRAGKAQARQIRLMANYNAKVQEMEAESMEYAAGIGLDRAYEGKRRGLAGTESALSKSGAQMSGTALDVMLQSAKNIQADINMQRRNDQLGIQRKKQQAKGTKWQGAIQAEQALSEARAKARDAMISGVTGAITSGIKAFGAGEFDFLKSSKSAGLNLTGTQTSIAGLNTGIPNYTGKANLSFASDLPSYKSLYFR